MQQVPTIPLIVVLSLIAQSDLSLAQDQLDQGQQSAGNTLDEIIVTAQKREQNLQNVPVSVTAFTGTDLEHAGIQDVTDLSYNVPGLAVTSTGPGETEVIIRGMPGRSGTAATVGYYIDEVPISAVTRNIDVMLFDLDRVEVLRGPQGTLYGASSMGGTIKYVQVRCEKAEFVTVRSPRRDYALAYRRK